MESTLDTSSISPAERMNMENRFAMYSFSRRASEDAKA